MNEERKDLFNENLEGSSFEESRKIVNNYYEKKSNGIGLAGFIIALIGLFIKWIPFIGTIVWFIGLVLSVVGIFKQPRGFAIAGTVISLIGIIISIIFVGAIGLMF